MTGPRTINLEFAAHAHVTLGQVAEVGPVLTGVRRIVPITGGALDGPLLTATIDNGGADWQTICGDGTAIIDTRYSARTVSGGTIQIETKGFRHGPADVIARVARGEEVDPDSYYFRVVAHLATGDPELAWVNKTVFVATACRLAADVHYDLYVVE